MTTIDKEFIENVLQMVKLYDEVLQTGTKISPSEFAKSNFCENKLFINQRKEGCFSTFFEICSMQDFLSSICEMESWPTAATGIVHTYLLLFYITPMNKDVILESIIDNFKIKERRTMMKFLSQDEIIDIVEKKVSSIYKDQKKREYILKEVKERIPTFRYLHVFMEKLRRENKIKSMKNNLDVGYHVLQAINSPEEVEIQNKYVEKKGSIQTVSSKSNISKKIKKKNLSAKTSNLDTITEADSLKTQKESTIEAKPMKKHAIPEICSQYQGPEIKQTITQVLREGARVQKKAEEAEKLFKDLCKGVQDPNKIESLLQTATDQKKENQLVEIERKHLLGKISHEQAKLAKLKVQQQNQLKAAALKSKNQELEEQLAEFRQQEEARLKETADKCRSYFENSKQAQETLHSQKKQTVKEVQEESRQLQVLINQRKQEELNAKINLIRQIKKLENSTKITFNNTDMYSLKSFSIKGSSAMSLEELKQALERLRERVKDQIALKKVKIQNEKNRKKALIASAKQTIDRYKSVSKPALAKINQNEFRPTPELIKLRKKLEKKKAEAMEVNKFL